MKVVGTILKVFGTAGPGLEPSGCETDVPTTCQSLRSILWILKNYNVLS